MLEPDNITKVSNHTATEYNIMKYENGGVGEQMIWSEYCVTGVGLSENLKNGLPAALLFIVHNSVKSSVTSILSPDHKSTVLPDMGH